MSYFQLRRRLPCYICEFWLFHGSWVLSLYPRTEYTICCRYIDPRLNHAPNTKFHNSGCWWLISTFGSFSFDTWPPLRTHNAPSYQNSRQAGNARLSYCAWTSLPASFSKGWGVHECSELIGPNCTKYRKYIGLSSLLYRNVLHFRYIAAFRNEGATRVKGDWIENRGRILELFTLLEFFMPYLRPNFFYKILTSADRAAGQR